MKSALCLLSALVAMACAQGPGRGAASNKPDPKANPAVTGIQEETTKPKKHTAPPPKVSNAPVTGEEAREAFTRAESVVRKALGAAAGASKVSIPKSTAPVAREAVVAEMVRFYNEFRSYAKLTPAAANFDKSRLKMSGPHRAELEKLIRMGMVAPIGPLATGPGSSMTIPDFGDALGFFLSRLAYMTHLPSSKWTPALRPEGE